jgi:hypothetical protein
MSACGGTFSHVVPNNLYQTEPWATRVALRKILLPSGAVVWEACAGGHEMADVLRAFGFDVLTSDIAEYGRRHDFFFDFLDTTATVPPPFCDAIITNPPYGPQNMQAAVFARLALLRCSGLVALLLAAKFDSGSSRGDLFQDNPRFLCKIVHRRPCLVCMGPGHRACKLRAVVLRGEGRSVSGEPMKLYANVYRSVNGAMGSVYATRELADRMVGRDRLDCIRFDAGEGLRRITRTACHSWARA